MKFVPTSRGPYILRKQDGAEQIVDRGALLVSRGQRQGRVRALGSCPWVVGTKAGPSHPAQCIDRLPISQFVGPCVMRLGRSIVAFLQGGIALGKFLLVFGSV